MEEPNYCVQRPLDCVVSVVDASLNAEPVYQPTLAEYIEAGINWTTVIVTTLAYIAL